MATILCVLYPDPSTGYPPNYIKDNIPELTAYADGQTLPQPEALGFKPGELVGCVSGALGLKKYLAALGHEFIVTDDKEGPDSVFEQVLPRADIVISQPFWPAYLTAERIAKAKNLKLAITAGIGSDHVDLAAAIQHDVTVAEVTYSNSTSVAEHVVMMILALVRNYLPAHKIASAGGWHIADIAARSYDLEGMQVGTIGAGRIGLSVLKRLHPFAVHLHYMDKHRLPKALETQLNLTYHANVESLLAAVDVVTINCPLHAETENLFDAAMIAKMRKGTYLINTARAKICHQEAIAAALKSGHLAGYAGDVWYPQPVAHDHPWRTMPFNGMTPHISGTTLSAQARYAAGVKEILECYFAKRPIRNEYLIVEAGQLAGAGKHAYSVNAKEEVALG